ncbi:MAG: hypothetical protein WDO15_11750 [Bacteroidota bacterium]
METTTTFLRDITAVGSTLFGEMKGINGSLFFSAQDGRGYELWKSDGTPAGTDIVSDIAAGTANSNPSGSHFQTESFTSSAYDPQNGTELWKTDGTTNGTSLVMDVAKGVDDSNPVALTSLGNNLYFFANDGTRDPNCGRHHQNNETKFVKELAPGTNAPPTYASWLEIIVAHGSWICPQVFGQPTGLMQALRY